jgi:RNA exonuclease 1
MPSLLFSANLILFYFRFSGITEEMLRDVKNTIVEAQVKFLEFVTAETIIVGHSLENDLKALQIMHSKVIDTALLYGHPHGPPKKPALRNLSRHYLGQVIQESSHDSAEDAIAALRLAKLKIVKGLEFGFPEFQSGSNAKLMEVLAEHGRKCAVFDDISQLKRVCYFFVWNSISLFRFSMETTLLLCMDVKEMFRRLWDV